MMGEMRTGGRRTTLWSAYGAALAYCCLSLTSSLAQDQTQTFRTEANYVRVDVYPTRDGQPVIDLTQQDFELSENGAPQTIEQFERVAIRAVGPQDIRSEPSTVEQSRQAATEPRARLFVLFLDVDHVEGDASQRVQRSLASGLNRIIGPDDLIAVMTPDMSARNLTFSRRTTLLEGMLTTAWGGRDRTERKDETEERYAQCYPGVPRNGRQIASDQGIAQEMILRRREKRALDALQDTVRVLRGLREERKAVLVITDGWRLFTPSNTLLRPIDVPPTNIAPVGVDPLTGKVTTTVSSDPSNRNPSLCERDRIALANLDDSSTLREIEDEANRANTSFYPIDPRGLVVFDEQIVPSAGVGVGRSANPTVGPLEDQQRLTARHESLRDLALATDGLALLETNNFAAGMRRIADDLSAYYLLGYYSTGKLDGKFHSISVRVKRPGVQVRARRGFLAAPSAATSTSIAPPPATGSADARAVDTALGSLGAIARSQSLLLHVAAGWTPAHAARVWVVAETVRPAGSVTPQSAAGGDIDALLIDSQGATVATVRARVEPGAQSTRLGLALPPSTEPGVYTLMIRTKGTDATTASNESAQVSVATSPSSTGALFFRRGPTTGNKDVPTADLRFRRSDRLRIEIPDPSEDAVTARLLDRRGDAINVPVAGAIRKDPDGVRWQTAELALAPLAPGDYVIEVSSGTLRRLIAFRLVP
jgi:VWFA-related protein